MSAPRVSVLLPVFNGARFLDESMGSILRQEHVDLELIVIDDASTDDTPRIIERWRRADSRVVVMTLSENRGASAALNAGLDRARGVYVARQDADDVSEPGRLAAQTTFLDRERDVVLLGARYIRIDAHGRTISTASPAESPAVLSYLLHFENAAGVPGQGMFRTDVARQIGGFSREFRYAQGYEMWARLARRGRVAVLPEVLLRYREHDANVSRLHAREQRLTAIEISRRTLSESLGRTVTLEEAMAVDARFRARPRRNVSALANGVVAEAMAAFERTKPAKADVERAHAITAVRFVRSAMTLATSGAGNEAAECLRIAVTWHPRSVPGIAWSTLDDLARRAANRARRTIPIA